MAIRKASAEWEGNLKSGKGTMSLGSGFFEGSYSFGSRFAEQRGTNPEELIGAALAGCFSMAFSSVLEEAGYKPERISTDAKVTLSKTDDGFKIASIDLETRGQVPGIDEEEFRRLAENAKNGCPVSKALTGVEKRVEARLSR